MAPWAVDHKASMPMGFSRQEYWSGVPFLMPGDLSHPGVKTVALVSPTFLTTSVTWEALPSLEFLNEFSSLNHSALMGKAKCFNMASGTDLQLSSSLTSIQPAWFFSFPNVASLFFFLPCGMWGLSSLTKDQTHAS